MQRKLLLEEGVNENSCTLSNSFQNKVILNLRHVKVTVRY